MLPASSIALYIWIFPEDSAREELSVAVGLNPALALIFGTAGDLLTDEGFTAWRSLALGCFFASLMAIFIVVRNSRASEDSGQAELFASGVMGREARLAARLSHPHVVAVYDLVEEERQQYLVMEYVEGTNLSGLLRARGPLLPDAAAALIGQAADALAAAHEAGIIHRDVKPSNMLVTEDGQLKLSDFGIARAEADPSLTQTGLVTGSPAYLAPEVASGGSAQDSSDVWSLGASLFHALTGHPPYEVSDNVLGALYRIVHEEPPRVPEPGWLGPVLAATMHRDPAERWPMARVRDFLQLGPDGAGVTLVTDPTAGTVDTEPGHHTQELATVPPVNTGPQPVVPAPTPRARPASQEPSQARSRRRCCWASGSGSWWCWWRSCSGRAVTPGARRPPRPATGAAPPGSPPPGRPRPPRRSWSSSRRRTSRRRRATHRPGSPCSPPSSSSRAAAWTATAASGAPCVRSPPSPRSGPIPRRGR